MSIRHQLGLREPLATCGTKDHWKVWTRDQATKALREMDGKQGLVPGGYALYSSMIGGTTRLAASGLQAWAIQREGRWKSNASMRYVRANRKDEGRASQALTQDAKAGGVQPGQGTMWGAGRGRCNC